MDRAAIARAQRRRQALDALEFERDRAAALHDQLETIVAELEGSAVDAEAFARMAPEDVELVRAVIDPAGLEDPEPVPIEQDWLEESFGNAEEAPADEREELETEIARLEQEIASSSRHQQALERYLEALGG